MNGRVAAINRKRGMILVEVEDGEYSLIELHGACEVSVGDILDGPLDSLGSEMVRNITQREEMSVFIQEAYMTKSLGTKMLGG